MYNCDPKVSRIVAAALRRYATAIREDTRTFFSDSRRLEELDAAMRATRIMRSATSLVGSFALNRVTHLLEELLEPASRSSCRLDSRRMGLVEKILKAIETYASRIESSSDRPAGRPESTRELMQAVKAYRRYRGLPRRKDDQAISNLLSPPAAFAGQTTSAGSPLRAPETTPDTDRSQVDDDATLDPTEQQEVPAELWEVFQEEACEHIDQIYATLQQLSNDLRNQDLIQAVRRSAHTLKGASGAVGLEVVMRLSHRMEDLLDAIYAGTTALNSELLHLLTATTDVLHDLCRNQIDSGLQERLHTLYAAYDAQCGAAAAANPSDRNTESPSPAQTSDPARQPSKTSGQDSKQASFVRIPTSRLDGLRKLVSELIVNRSSIGQGLDRLGERVTELQSVLDMLHELSHDMNEQRANDGLSPLCLDAAAEPPRPNDRSSIGSGEFDELEFDRFSTFDLWSQSVSEATSAIGSIRHDLKSLADECGSLLSQQDRLTLETQDRLVQIQMVPLDTILPQLRRAVREVAAKENKEATLVVKGENVELDKNVLEQLVEPLMHLLRNAVDHGIETADDRARRKKPAAAKVRISLAHFGTQVVIRLSDDGRGLDADKIRAKAIAGQYVARQEAARLSDAEVYRYIFLPGFSTATAISEISGRGVGMDVVRNRVEELQGRIDVDSVRDQGTTFTIRLPVSLATTRALMLTAGDQLYALPQSAVRSIARIESSMIERHPEGQQIVFENRRLPLICLSKYLGLEQVEEPADGAPLVAILAANDRRIALQVDGVLPGRDIVVQPLANHLADAAGLLGAALHGDGTVVPILDPTDLLDRGDIQPAAPSEGQRFEQPTSLTVMIVDDSISVRRVLQNIVENAGWTAVPARDGVAALEALASLENLPDVFLLDVEMPRMDGFELLRTLREKEAFAETPIIMITSRAGVKHRQRANRLGATAYLTKPFQPEALLEAIQQHSLSGAVLDTAADSLAQNDSNEIEAKSPSSEGVVFTARGPARRRPRVTPAALFRGQIRQRSWAIAVRSWHSKKNIRAEVRLRPDVF